MKLTRPHGTYFHTYKPILYSRVTLYTAGLLHTAVPHCSHSRAPIVHTAVPRENNEHGCVYLRCRAVCKLPGCVEGHPWYLKHTCQVVEHIWWKLYWLCTVRLLSSLNPGICLYWLYADYLNLEKRWFPLLNQWSNKELFNIWER